MLGVQTSPSSRPPFAATRFERLIGRLGVDDVERGASAAPGVVANLLRHRLRRLSVDVEAGDARALAGGAESHRAADAGAGADDHHNLSIQAKQIRHAKELS